MTIIKHKLEKYLKKSCQVVSDQHFPLEYLEKCSQYSQAALGATGMNGLLKSVTNVSFSIVYDKVPGCSVECMTW